MIYNDVKQALTCICIAVLLKDDIKFCRFRLKSNAHVGLYDGMKCMQ